MEDIVKAENFMKEAAKKMMKRSFTEAGDSYQKAGYLYEKLNLWVEAAEAYVKVAECRSASSEDMHYTFAAMAFVQAAYHYKSADDYDKATSCLEKAVRQYEILNKFDQAARFCKVAGEWYEKQSIWEGAIFYFQRAANHFHRGNNDSEAECREKVKELNDKKNRV